MQGEFTRLTLLDVLAKEPKLSDRFYELVMEAERKVAKQAILKNDFEI